MPPAAAKLRHDCAIMAFAMRRRECRQRGRCDLWVIAWLKQYRRIGVDCLRGRKTRAYRFKHLRVGIARYKLKASIRERRYHELGLVPDDDNHLTANAANRIVSGGNERFVARRRLPGQ